MYQIQPPTNEPIIAKQAFVTRQQPLLDEVCNDYGRDPAGLCLKVFYGNPLKEGETLEDALWGDNHDPKDPNQVRRNTKLLVGTKIQNFMWLQHYAPRVYAVFEAEYEGKRVAVQLTEFLDGPHCDDIKKVESLHDNWVAGWKRYYGFNEVKDILSCRDMINGKIVDWQQYAFDPDVEDRIKAIYFEKGRYGKVYYQAVPELGLNGGPRKSLDRVGFMQLDKIDFTGKVVWDIGCAGGFFCRYALSRGAKIVYGMDMPDPCEAAYTVSNYLGYFNVEYVACDLSKGVPPEIPNADIAFFLSMNYHIPVPQRLLDVPTVIFEDNGKETRQLDHLGEPWTSHFKKIEFVGRGLDHGDKAIYHLQKEEI